jgi:uncharacterized membrane protein
MVRRRSSPRKKRTAYPGLGSAPARHGGGWILLVLAAVLLLATLIVLLLGVVSAEQHFDSVFILSGAVSEWTSPPGSRMLAQ